MNYSVSQYESELQEVAEEKLFTVFLCGPTLKDLTKPSAALRQLILDDLRKEGFEVVLGEDDGLMQLQDDFGGDAQTNEIGFIRKKADAVVLIADSPGSFSELGLFSHYHFSSERKFPFVLIINDSFDGDGSYIAQGPVQLVEASGKIIFADLENEIENYDTEIKESLMKQLKTIRFATLMDPNSA